MEKQLSWVLKLSLEEIAFRRIMVTLWNKTIILASNKGLNLKAIPSDSIRIQNANGEYYVSNINKVVEGMVKEDVLKLVLPKSLQKRMMNLVKPIGLEILKWQIYHEKFLNSLCKNSYIHILKQLYWTSTGVIDYRKTAEELIRLDMLDVVKQYQLACLYCLVDYIPLLWKEFPEETKGHFYNKSSNLFCGEAKLESYWTYVLKGEVSKLDSIVSRWFGEMSSFHRLLFEESARRGNKAATEYFFGKLTYGERNSLFSIIHYIIVLLPNLIGARNNFLRGKFSAIVCFFLSMMTFEEQMKLLRQWPCEILGYFLDWPWQDLFLDIADVIWTFLPESSYDKVLHKIAENIQHTDYYFPDLIQKFFQRSPSNFRNHFVNNECNTFCLFPKFFDAEDTETIRVIFRMVDAKDRARLVSSYPFYELFDDLMMRNKWQLVELCLRESLLSIEDIKRLKKAFGRFFTSERNKMLHRKLRLKQLFEFLEKMETKNPAKGSSKETKTKIKKLCSEKQTNNLL